MNGLTSRLRDWNGSEDTEPRGGRMGLIVTILAIIGLLVVLRLVF
jgi:hypothetical protein